MAERLLNPQQELFLKHYLDPKSDTFSNALQSALKAKYSQEYAENITALLPDWLSEAIGDKKMIEKAERNLRQVQDLEFVDGEGKIATDILRERTKVDMFIAERLNKRKYSQRQEIADPEGKPIPLQIINITPIDAGKND